MQSARIPSYHRKTVSMKIRKQSMAVPLRKKVTYLPSLSVTRDFHAMMQCMVAESALKDSKLSDATARGDQMASTTDLEATTDPKIQESIRSVQAQVVLQMSSSVDIACQL
jgi:hypothetical protein